MGTNKVADSKITFISSEAELTEMMQQINDGYNGGETLLLADNIELTSDLYIQGGASGTFYLMSNGFALSGSKKIIVNAASALLLADDSLAAYVTVSACDSALLRTTYASKIKLDRIGEGEIYDMLAGFKPYASLISLSVIYGGDRAALSDGVLSVPVSESAQTTSVAKVAAAIGGSVVNFNFKITGNSSIDKVEAALRTLYTYLDQGPTVELYGNLYLPISLKQYDCTISWWSSNNGVLNSSGILCGQGGNVTLIATVIVNDIAAGTLRYDYAVQGQYSDKLAVLANILSHTFTAVGQSFNLPTAAELDVYIDGNPLGITAASYYLSPEYASNLSLTLSEGVYTLALNAFTDLTYLPLTISATFTDSVTQESTTLQDDISIFIALLSGTDSNSVMQNIINSIPSENIISDITLIGNSFNIDVDYYIPDSTEQSAARNYVEATGLFYNNDAHLFEAVSLQKTVITTTVSFSGTGSSRTKTTTVVTTVTSHYNTALEAQEQTTDITNVAAEPTETGAGTTVTTSYKIILDYRLLPSEVTPLYLIASVGSGSAVTKRALIVKVDGALQYTSIGSAYYRAGVNNDFTSEILFNTVWDETAAALGGMSCGTERLCIFLREISACEELSTFCDITITSGGVNSLKGLQYFSRIPSFNTLIIGSTNNVVKTVGGNSSATYSVTSTATVSTFNDVFYLEEYTSLTCVKFCNNSALSNVKGLANCKGISMLYLRMCPALVNINVILNFDCLKWLQIQQNGEIAYTLTGNTTFEGNNMEIYSYYAIAYAYFHAMGGYANVATHGQEYEAMPDKNIVGYSTYVTYRRVEGTRDLSTFEEIEVSYGTLIVPKTIKDINKGNTVTTKWYLVAIPAGISTNLTIYASQYGTGAFKLANSTSEDIEVMVCVYFGGVSNTRTFFITVKAGTA